MPERDPHPPRDGIGARKTTDKRGGMIEPIAKTRPPTKRLPLGEVPEVRDTTKPRMTPRDTDPTLVTDKVEPVKPRLTEKFDAKNPW